MKPSSFYPRLLHGLTRFGLIAIFFLIPGCQSQSAPTSLPRSTPSATGLHSLPTLIPTHTLPPSPTKTATLSPTPTPTPCAEAAGEVRAVKFNSPILGEPIPAQVYLPPCYADAPPAGYPLLLMLHGQMGDQTAWQKLGLLDAADRLITQGEIPPLVIVMPFEHQMWSEYWESQYPQALLKDVLPQVDQQFNLNPLPQYRAIGGYSRGANWAVRIGFTQPGLFSSIGGHSYVTFSGDTNMVKDWIKALDAADYPRLLIDIGENDYYLPFTKAFQAELTRLQYPHDYRLQPGAHEYAYWEMYAADYLRWYAEACDE